MKFIKTLEKSTLMIEDYKYNKFTPHFVKIEKDLIEAGTLLIAGGIISAFIVYSFLMEDKNTSNILSALFTAFLGTVGTIGTIGRPNLVGYRFSKPAEITDHQKKTQIIIKKFKRKIFMILSVIPYLLWLLYELKANNLPLIGKYDYIFFVGLFSFICTTGISLGIMYWQVYWSLDRHIKQHEME
jgi:hypothetical protein